MLALLQDPRRSLLGLGPLLGLLYLVLVLGNRLARFLLFLLLLELFSQLPLQTQTLSFPLYLHTSRAQRACTRVREKELANKQESQRSHKTQLGANAHASARMLTQVYHSELPLRLGLEHINALMLVREGAAVSLQLRLEQ